MTQLPTPSSADRSASWYAGATWLRAAVGAIPYIGGSLDLVLSHRGQRLAKQRVEQMLSVLELEMQRVKAESLRADYLDSEEWTDLVRLSLERAARVRSQDHLRGIARVLRGAATGAIQSTSHAESLIDILAEIREEEALILRVLYVRGGGAGVHESQSVPSPAGFRAEDLELPAAIGVRTGFLLKRLEASGLVDPGSMTASGAFEGKYRLTSAGRELCNLVHASEVSE